MTRKPMLMVIQSRSSSTGRVGTRLRQRGYALDVRCPVAGDALPERMDGHAGAVVFGGPMSANDDDSLPGLRAQLRWIPRAVESGRPFLGICLGAQLLARAYGAPVARHPQGLAEIGYFEIRPTAAGAELFDAPLAVYHWHEEGFELPPGAVLLAEGAHFPHQAYRYAGNAFGLQFHPEVTREMMEAWVADSTERLAAPGAQSAEEQRAGHARHDPGLAGWLEGFLERWLSGGDGDGG